MPIRTPDNKRYVINPKTNCWEYVMALNQYGYGIIKDNKNSLAHRYFYEKYKGKIKKGLELDHKCRNRKCVNPNHLEAVLHKVNITRGLLTKLNISQIKEIRDNKNLSKRELSKKFNIGLSSIYHITTYHTWN